MFMTFIDRALILALVFLIALGCKIGATNENVAVDKVRPSQTPASSSPSPSPANANAGPEPTPDPSKASNVVCSDPAKPCHHPDKHFDDWELSFKMPAKLKPNSEYRSGPFYGVILKVYPIDDCDGGEFIEAAETERKREQASRRDRKVFASYECPNMGAVGYEFDGRWDAKRENLVIGNFIAIYAGTTESEADQILNSVKGTYPKAQIKKMTATFEVIEQ